MTRSRMAIAALIVSACASPALANPYCAADINDNGTVNIFDVFAFLDFYKSGDPAADFNNDSAFDIFDVFAFLDEYNQCDLTDSDGDRIPDWAETDNGIYESIFSTGTDPFNADTDGDAIRDGDEVLGTAEGLDLPALGASPLRKDIFVECDWFAGFIQGHNVNFRPTAAGEQRLKDAFADSGVENPYGLPTGISLHLDYGQGGAFTGGNQLEGEDEYVEFLGTRYNALRSNNFAPNRRGYFHYAMLANRYNSPTNGSSGVAELHGDDMMVTLFSVNNDYNQTQTFMHELGHNLGLHHGGHESKNYKPNYNSVMNYRYQFPGADIDLDLFGDGLLDYSHGLNNPLNETALHETTGVSDTPLDINLNGIIEQFAYALNINCGAGVVEVCGSSESNCSDNTCDTLLDSDDWSSIDWHRLDGSRDSEVVECETAPLRSNQTN